MKAIIKREIRNYLRNPILWVGIIIVIFGVYQAVNPYLQIRYFESQAEIEAKTSKVTTISEIADADIMEGFVPTNEEQRRQIGCEVIEEQLVGIFGMAKGEASEVMAEIEAKDMTMSEITEYLDKEHGFPGADFYFELYEYYGGTMEEANHYISSSLEEHPFSYYFARKFADFGGLFMGFFSAILLAFLFIRDTRRDTYELLHTKPISARAYILGKAGGGLAVSVFVLVILNLVFGILCAVAGKQTGFAVRFWDFPLATICYILPNMLMIVSVYTSIALIFKTPLPAAPLLFLYMIYSNMGSRGADGNYGYYGQPLAIMVRFPGKFFEVAPPPMAVMNQLFLVVASVILLISATWIWKRRRNY